MRGIGHLWLNDWSEGLGKEAVCKLGQAGPGRDVLGVMGYKTLALDKPKQGRYRFPGMVSSGRNCYWGMVWFLLGAPLPAVVCGNRSQASLETAGKVNAVHGKRLTRKTSAGSRNVRRGRN